MYHIDSQLSIVHQHHQKNRGGKLDLDHPSPRGYFFIRFQTSRFSSPGRVEPTPKFKLQDFEIWDLSIFRKLSLSFFRICPPSLEPFFEHLEPSPSGSDHTTRSAIDFYAKNRKSAPWRAHPPRNPPRIFSTFFF